ncbi:MAG TPA: hypothetical protein VK166_09015 [Chitinophagaceae bacterium]|nr:hypothetical protein [Chitinophagaceae bacterium]
MNPVWRHMAMSVFEKQDPQQLTVEEIDQVIERYPYFAVLHFIKTGKLMAEGNPDADSSASKTALYFSNPHWLHHQLNRVQHTDEAEESMAEILTTHTDPEVYEELEEETIIPEAEIEQEDLEEEYDDKRIYAQEEIVIEKDDIVPAVELIETEETIIDEIVPAIENQWEDETIPDEIVPAVDNEWMVDSTGEITSNPGSIPEETDIAPEEEPVLKEELPAENAALAENTPAPEVSAGSFIPIEPLYTIDYFASQGIKLPVDEIPDDQLGKKLKSFTQWLKSMKKLHPEKVDRQMDKDTENHIRIVAEHSNDSEEVYTEALAEVYQKQGLEDKAIEVYKKLSLLDPSKSAYFAARIREIKEI